MVATGGWRLALGGEARDFGMNDEKIPGFADFSQHKIY